MWIILSPGKGWFIVVELSQGHRVVLLPGPADWAVTAFAKEFKMRLVRRVIEQIFAFTGSELEKCGSVFSDVHFQSQQTLFIPLLHLQSGLCHCRVDADVLFVPLGL
ncbi:hypothetical protein T07_11456 [Trichinella nelsoni]|uniref:Uncharacterized protein n=1 Tax=Trichinella nelsoni TaxID=6336 RepID=A0A0V0RMF6_9BILA|nr:hypothetical protein T07_11456 [Trichinella nelsoni]